MKRITILAFLLVLSFSASLAQEKKDFQSESSLNIEWSPYNSFGEYRTPVNLNIRYNKSLSRRLQISASLFSQFGQYDVLKNSHEAVTGVGNSIRNLQASINLDLRYYLARDNFDGHFISAQVNNLVAVSEGEFYGLYRPSRYGATQDHYLPYWSVGYGYKWKFSRDFYLESFLGYVPYEHVFDEGIWKNVNFKITLGYNIPITGRK